MKWLSENSRNWQTTLTAKSAIVDNSSHQLGLIILTQQCDIRDKSGIETHRIIEQLLNQEETPRLQSIQTTKVWFYGSYLARSYGCWLMSLIFWKSESFWELLIELLKHLLLSPWFERRNIYICDNNLNFVPSEKGKEATKARSASSKQTNPW